MKPFVNIFLVCAFILVLVDFSGKCNCKNIKDKLVGGLLEEKEVTEEVRQMVTNSQIPITTAIRSTRLGFQQSGDLTPISYRTQLVNGTNYFIKVRATVGKKYVYYHIRIYKSFDGAETFMNFVGPMTLNEGIEFF